MYRVLRISAMLVLVMAMTLVANLRAVPAQASTLQTYIVLYKGQSVPSDAANTIAAAGGTLVASYNAIGVAIARSSNANFGNAIAADSRVEGAAATGGFATRVGGDNADANGPAPSAPVSDNDTFSGLQWDMRQIHTPEAHAITGGSPAVLVGDLDTGLDYTHPDLAANIDFANSVSCVGGVPNQAPSAWDDDNGHGTHTAGTIAAASNGIGIVGVAPNVRIAGVKTGDSNGFFYPEAVVCAFMWAGSHHFDVTNNSYFADPWLFNCKNDPVQRAIWKAESRAIRYAIQQGVTIVSATGNNNFDLSHPVTDPISPDDGTPITREVTNACAIVPVEVPGVIGVSANGNLGRKSYYSNYGVSETEVVAPGGDRLTQVTPAAPNGRVLSTYPSKFFNPSSSLMLQDCSVSPCATYAYLQGTSMASPHVTGVVALIKSVNPHATPGQVRAIVDQTADPVPCPPNPYDPTGNGAWLADCQGGTGHNGFYGSGQVNALSAVTR